MEANNSKQGDIDVKRIVENALKAAKELDIEQKADKSAEESFDCPECGGKVRGGQVHCGNCGVELEWEA